MFNFKSVLSHFKFKFQIRTYFICRALAFCVLEYFALRGPLYFRIVLAITSLRSHTCANQLSNTHWLYSIWFCLKLCLPASLRGFNRSQNELVNSVNERLWNACWSVSDLPALLMHCCHYHINQKIIKRVHIFLKIIKFCVGNAPKWSSSNIQAESL